MWRLFANDERKITNERERLQLFKATESRRLLVEAARATSEVATDITARLRARLEDSIRTFETTIRILTDALLICDLDGNVEAHNPAAERIFGYLPDEMRLVNITHLFARTDSHKPLDISTLWHILDEARGTGAERTLRTNHEPMDNLRGKRKSGSLFWCDVGLSHLERRADGRTVMVLLVRDVTARYEIEQQLTISENQYRALFEHSFDGIVIIQNCRILAVNPAAARLWGYNVEALIMQPYTLLLDSEPIPLQSGEISARDSSGRLFRLLANVTEIKWSGDQTATLLLVKESAGY